MPTGAIMYWTEEKKQSAVEIIFKHIETGKSLRSILDNADRKILPSRFTFFDWLNKDESLANQYARVCDIRAEHIFEEILEIADKQDKDVEVDSEGMEIINHNIVQRNRLQIDARKWMLGKMNPKKYGDKIQQEHSGKVDGMIVPIMNIDPLSKDAGDNSVT